MNSIIAAIQQFNLEVEKIHEVPESFSSTVNILTLNSGEKVVLKIPFSKSKLKREKQILELLDNKIAVPKVIAYWEGNENNTGALLLSYIDGHPIIGNISQSLAFDMGVLLAKLHQIKMPSYQLVGSESGDWWKSIRIKFYERIDECKGHIDNSFLIKCSIRFEEMFSNLPKSDGPVLVHFDYRPGNILVKDDKIIGLIDFETSRGGSPDIDFTKVKVSIWDEYKGTKESFLNGYKSITVLPNIDKTLPFYLFYDGFAGIAWCVKRNRVDDDFYTENYNQVMDYIR